MICCDWRDASKWRRAEVVAIGSVLRNWPHVFSILNMFGECAVIQVDLSTMKGEKGLDWG